MKKNYFFIGLILSLIVTFTNAQNVIKSANITKSALTKKISTSVQTTIKRCGTTEAYEIDKLLDPTLEMRMQEFEEYTQKWIKEHPNGSDNKTVITVPVVVHIVYSNSAQNISDARVQEQIAVLNTDYSGQNTHSMTPFSNSLKCNTELQFCLAQRDPSGNATTGIERRQTTHGDFSSMNKDERHYSTGGLDQWDPHKYMNIWVCDLSYGLCGYATFPTTTLSNTYGVSINYRYFGLTGALAPYNLGGTTTHEIGHCFGLRHIWGDDNGACSGTDYCNDTPNQANATSGTHSGVLTDACTSTSPGIMYMNFMDYSDDIEYANFTPDQKSIIQSLFTSGGVLNLLASSNGCVPPGGGSAPVANFSASPTTVAINGTVNFADLSTNNPTSWQWTLTPSTGFTYTGGTSSTSQNPKITFNTVGNYAVALKATNSYGNNTNNKSNYINVTSGTTSGCDTAVPPSVAGTCIDSLVIYYIDNSPYDSGWVSGSNAYLDKEKAMKYTGVSNGMVSDVIVLYAMKSGTTGNTSVKIYSNNGGNPGTVLGTSAIISKSAIDTTNFGINFNNVYHFSTPVSVSNDFFVSVVLPTTWANQTDELAIWSERISCSANSGDLAYEMWGDNTWHAFNSTSAYNVNIDMMILPVICTNVGVNDIITDNNITIYPNPAKNEFTIDFSGISAKEFTVNIYNTLGKCIKNYSLDNNTDNIQINMSDHATGIYFVNVKTPTGTIIKKLSLIN